MKIWNILIQIVRILTGALFIFSGFIKANDPMGFGYKMDEYFGVFGMDWAKPLALSLSIFVCIFEIVLGVMLLIGSKRNLTLTLLFLMIVFFTFLTWYSATYEKVTDCGCFGDFLHLEPWQSFYKDLALLVAIVILFFGRKFINPIFSPKLEMGVLVIVTLASIAFPIYTYNYLPVLDFRPYKVGTNIVEAMSTPEGAPQAVIESHLFYKNLKTGEVQEFTLQNYPWKDTLNWAHDTTINVVIQKAYQPPIHDFHINTLDGFEYTEDILNDPGYKFFLVAYDLDKTNTDAFLQMNDFAKLCAEAKIPFMVFTASSASVEAFKAQHKLNMDFYLVDATQLKTMIRSNPGLMLLKGPVVTEMWHYHCFPSFSEVKEKYLK
jgi:uncharacterized membrane protein YphA (DoxX/SURF4 family)